MDLFALSFGIRQAISFQAWLISRSWDLPMSSALLAGNLIRLMLIELQMLSDFSDEVESEMFSITARSKPGQFLPTRNHQLCAQKGIIGNRT